MPRDSAGNFHFNSQRAHAADRMASAKPKEPPSKKVEHEAHAEEHESEGMKTELHDNGDGTYHTKTHDGEEADHPHIGHALMHIAGKHAPESKHFHASHDGMSITAHSHENGETSEGKEHEDTESAKEHLGAVMDGGDGMEGHEQNEDTGDMAGMSLMH